MCNFGFQRWAELRLYTKTSVQNGNLKVPVWFLKVHKDIFSEKMKKVNGDSIYW